MPQSPVLQLVCLAASTFVMSFDSSFKKAPFSAPYIVSVKPQYTVSKEGLTKKPYGPITTLQRPSCEVTAVLNFRFLNMSAFKNCSKLSHQKSFVGLSNCINKAKHFYLYLPIFDRVDIKRWHLLTDHYHGKDSGCGFRLYL